MAAVPKLDSLEERLMDHAKSFDSLLSLMPADVYFGKDNSDQWQRKKQAKEEKKAAKRAKLDPDNAKTAKDVFDEQAANARKRKREDDGERATTEDEGIAELAPMEQPTPDFQHHGNQEKKQKRGADDTDQAPSVNVKAPDAESKRTAKADKAREKKEKKKAKLDKKVAKAEAKKARNEQEKALVDDSEAAAAFEGKLGDLAHNVEEAGDRPDEGGHDDADIEPIEMDNGFAEEDLAATASPSPVADISVFDGPNQDSGSSSISSIVPPTTDQPPSLSKPKPSTAKLDITADSTTTTTTTKPDSNPEALKARLAARIEALRTARKASDPSRAPQNRQELIDSRRRKEEERKAHKKELRKKAKAEEATRRSDTLARGSPLLSNTNSPLLLSPGSPAAVSTSESNNNNFSFNRISFAPGGHHHSALTPSGSSSLPPSSSSLAKHSQKGPSDPLTALRAAEHKQSRLASLPSDKQASIAEKDLWQRAQQRVSSSGGDHLTANRVRKDDTSLLKKTLKRKEKMKKKSEREWNERLEGVEKAQAARGKKREGNLLKRREEKMKGKGKGKKMQQQQQKKKQKARPGFEGSFKAKAPSTPGAAAASGARKEKPRRR